MLLQDKETSSNDVETTNSVTICPKPMYTNLDIAGDVHHPPDLTERCNDTDEASLANEVLLAKNLQPGFTKRMSLDELHVSPPEARELPPKFAQANGQSLEQSIRQKDPRRAISLSTPTPGMQRRGHSGYVDAFFLQRHETYIL